MRALTPLYIIISVIVLAWLLYDKFALNMDRDGRNSRAVSEERRASNEPRSVSSSIKPSSDSNNSAQPVVSKPVSESSSRLVDVDALLNAFLESPDQFDLIGDPFVALVEGLIKRGDYSDAIKVLYDMRLYVEPGKVDSYDAFIFEQVGEIDSILQTQQQTQNLIAVYQDLLNLHPEHANYALSLAKWQLSLGLFDEAEQSLSWVVNDFDSQAQLDALKAQIDDARTFGVSNEKTIPLVRVGSQYLISVLVAGLNVELLIDTGASKTVIKESLVPRVGNDWVDLQAITVNTANSQTVGRVLEVSSLSLGGVELGRSRVIALALDKFKYDGLLGMDVLSQFEFTIDQDASELRLSRL